MIKTGRATTSRVTLAILSMCFSVTPNIGFFERAPGVGTVRLSSIELPGPEGVLGSSGNVPPGGLGTGLVWSECRGVPDDLVEVGVPPPYTTRIGVWSVTTGISRTGGHGGKGGESAPTVRNR